MYYVLVGLYVLVCFLLLIVVLLQQGKGGDIAAAFGGSSSQTAFGARAGATFLTRATTVLATIFMLGAFGLGVLGRHTTGGSVVGDVGAPVQTAPAAPALPMNAPAVTPPAGAPAASPTVTPPATPTKTPEATKAPDAPKPGK
jgi:preprotein translocase subunit SecG